MDDGHETREARGPFDTPRHAGSDTAAETSLVAEIERTLAVERLASGLAHELRNPLATLIQAAHYLERRNTNGDDEFAAVLASISESAQRIDTVVSRIEKVAAAGLEMVLVDLNAVVADAIDASGAGLEPQASPIKVILSPEVPGILGDPAKLRRLLVAMLKLSRRALGPSEPGRPRPLEVRTRLGRFERWGAAPREQRPGDLMPGDPAVLLEVERSAMASTEADAALPGPDSRTPLPGFGSNDSDLVLARKVVEWHRGALEIEDRSSRGHGARLTAAFRLPAAAKPV